MSYDSLTRTHQLQPQVQTETTDDFGGTSRTWANSGGLIWCRLQPMSQEQRITFRQAGLEGSHIAYLNEKPSPIFDTTYRFLFGTRVLQFRGIIDTDESARSPLQVIRMVLFEDSRDQ